MNKIELFLKELRGSADRVYTIFTNGSCVQLYFILKVFYPKARLYWSGTDNHAVTKIKGSYYDIGGNIGKDYIKQKEYYYVRKKNHPGYRLIKYSEIEALKGVCVEKYFR